MEIDSAGQSWGKSAPLAVPAGGGNRYDSTVQNPTVVFTHFDDQVGSWNIDPSTQDSDPATDEITVTNLLGEDVAVERCTIAGGNRTACMPLGTVAPQADLRTVETPMASSKTDHPALFIHLASDASQSYQRDLALGSGVSGSAGPACQNRADLRDRRASDSFVQPDRHPRVRDVHLLRELERAAMNA